MNRNRRLILPLLCGLPLAFMGCSGETPPIEALSTADMAVNRALDAKAAEGYTDSTGTAAYNLELSGFRAQAVESFLQQNGVEAERMTTQGFGLNNPVASNKTESGRQENRRVEVVISESNNVSSLKNGF